MRATLILLLALSHDAWLEDFHQLLAEISSHYANLDSAIDDRKIDLAALKTRTEDRLRQAKDDEEARAAIDGFMAAFGDGHAFIKWNAAAPAAPAASDDRPLCERLGYAGRPAGGIDFARLGGDFETMPDAQFPGGLLRLPGKRTAGVLRITLFSERMHPQLCSAAQKTLRMDDHAPCDDQCDTVVERQVADLLTAALERRVESLVRAGAKLIVVDLTGNGGGSNWVEPAARVLTPKPLRSPRLAFLRHPHWVRQLKERLADVEADQEAGREPWALLAEAAATLRRAIAEAEKPCERSAVWTNAAPDCQALAREPLRTSGVVAYAKPGAFAGLQSQGVLFLPALYRYREGVNRLPLYVLVDGGTASAAEYFAAMLQDNHAATLVGLPTYGSGCGHTNGGIDATLRNSGGSVRLPDCARLRADGTNEVTGIVPDAFVPWGERDSRYQRAVKAKQALAKIVN
ncbi:MAG TPA: S41 family peptidase [Thermoanaerobaculia bacterium]|nr:S41 family peptidase [Thermoanaerobaculia bacterium]